MAHGCPVGTLCNELAKLGHTALAEVSGLFTLFRDWLARQFVVMGRAADADALAMHLLMRSQGVATLATAFHDEAFVAHNTTRAALEERLNEAAFVAEDAVTADILDITPGGTDERLAFLKA